MDLEDLRNLYDRDQRVEVRYPDARRDVTGGVIRHVLISGRKHGWVLWSTLTADTADAAIEEQRAYFDSLGYSFEWKVYSHDQPADLKDRLMARGFVTREPDDAIMVLDLHNLPEVLHQPVPDSIRRLTTPNEIPAVANLLTEIWQEDFSFLGDELAEQMRQTPEMLSVYAAVLDDRVVSVGWSQFTDNSQFVGLWGGSTLPAYRRQGLYTGLLAIRAQEAQARGRRFLTVDASPMSRPILERFGFVTIAMATACEWEPPTE